MNKHYEEAAVPFCSRPLPRAARSCPELDPLELLREGALLYAFMLESVRPEII